MSSLEELPKSVCRVVQADGSLAGTAFFVLPGGIAITCYHVVYGLDSIGVLLPGETEVRSAEYEEARSNPLADIAVLKVQGVDPPAVQLSRISAAELAHGYGYRPGTLKSEPSGHTFAGRLTRGQPLHLRADPKRDEAARSFTDGIARPWNKPVSPYQISYVYNFELVEGVTRGISGGPIYDRKLRRVTGIFRAVQGSNQAYVLPIDAVSENWPELMELNRNTVRDSTLDLLWNRFRIRLVREGELPVEPPIERHLEEVYRIHDRFGGRSDELRRLLDFAALSEGGYLFVTGPPLGYGKTALLAAFVKELAKRPIHRAVHFLSESFVDWLDLDACLSNLCQQLMQIHDLGGQLPSKPHDLRALFAELIGFEPPDGRPIVVVMDGLEEAAKRWLPDRGMFPPELPRGVHVVVSAQEVADRNWSEQLGPHVTDSRVMSIEALSEADVAEVIRAFGVELPDAVGAAKRLRDLSHGCAFYLVALLLRLKDTGGDLDALGPSYEPGDFLRRWWDRIADDAFCDLLGTLAVASAPLGRDELVNISKEDALKGRNIGRVIDSAAPYISGSRKAGYQLKHPLVRQFVLKTMHDEIDDYRQSVANFILTWNDAQRAARESGYPIKYGVRQLVDADRAEALFDFLNADYLTEKWHQERSYQGHIADLTLAAKAVHGGNPRNAARAFGLVVARCTIREIVLGFPANLFTAWIRMGDTATALAAIEDMLGIAIVANATTGARGPVDDRQGQRTAASGSTPDLCLIAAEALLAPEDADLLPTGTSCSRIGARLLEYALETYPAIRLPFMKTDALDRFDRVAKSPRLAPEERARLARLLERLASVAHDPIEAGCLLGLAANQLLLSGGLDEARKILRRASDAGDRVSYRADQLLVVAYRVSALFALEPEALDHELAELDAINEPRGTFPLSGASRYRLFVGKIASIGESSVPFLRKLARFVSEDIEGRAHDGGFVVCALLARGDVDPAAQLIELAHHRSGETFERLARNIDDLRPLQSLRVRDWWDDLIRYAEPAALFGIDRYEAGIARLTEPGGPYGPQDALDSLTRLAGMRKDLGQVSGMRPSFERLVERIPFDERAAAYAALASIYFEDKSTAATYAEKSLRLASAKRPDGAPDDLSSLYAVALHSERRFDEAARAISMIGNTRTSLRTLNALLDNTAPSEEAAIDQYGAAVVDVLEAARRAMEPAGDYSDAAASVVAHTCKHTRLNDPVLGQIRKSDVLTGMLTLDMAMANWQRDPALGRSDFEDLWKSVEASTGRDRLQRVADLLSALSRMPGLGKEDAENYCSRAAELTLNDEPASDARIRLELVKSELLSTHSPDEAIALIERQLVLAREPRMRSFGEEAALRFLVSSGLMTGPAGDKLDEQRHAVDIWRASLRVLPQRPTRAIANLRQTLRFIAGLGSPPDESAALAGLFASLLDVAPTHTGTLRPVVEETLAQAESINRDDLQYHALRGATVAFAEMGDMERARAAAMRIRAEGRRKHMAYFIDAFGRRRSWSVVDKHAFVLSRNKDFAQFMISYLPSGRDADDWVNLLVDSAISESGAFDSISSRSMLLDRLTAIACILFRFGGSVAIREMLDTILTFDQRLVAAGQLAAAP